MPLSYIDGKAMPLGESTPLNPNKTYMPVSQLLWAILPALLGNVVEFYDYAAYTSLTPELTDNFYAEDDTVGREFGVWIAFAVGQCARPIGALIFGYIGDKYGRRPAIIIGTIGMVICTTLIGVVPTRRCCGESWGQFGFAVTIALRLVQGMCAAGELASAAAFSLEAAAPQQAGFVIGLLACSGTGGFLIASGIAALLENTMETESLLDWGWRLPFVLALPVGVGFVCYQMTMQESAEFQHAKEHSSGHVFKELFANYKLHLIICWGFTASHAAWHYGTVTYAKDFLYTAGLCDVRTAGIASMLMMTVALFGEFGTGLLADRVGFVRGMRYWLMLSLLLTYPCWMLLVAPTPGSHAVLMLGAIITGLLYSGNTVVLGVSLSLFPTNVRTSGFGLAYNMAQLCFAAPAPFAAGAMWAALSNGGQLSLGLGGNSIPAVWTMLGVLVSGCAYLGLYYAVRTGAMATTSHVRHEPF